MSQKTYRKTYLKPYLAVSVTAMLLSACASMPTHPKVVPVTETVPLSHYEGTWLEIGRRPMWLTNGCVAGYETYTAGAKPGEIAVEDGCHKTTPAGNLKTIKARGTITDFGGANAKLQARYPFFITYNYWVLYEAPDHSWFISATPSMHDLWIYTRAVPNEADKAVMVTKAKELGYDTSLLEFPAH